MSKDFRPWKIDEAQLLPPSVQDYAPEDHLSRLIVTLCGRSLIFRQLCRLSRHARVRGIHGYRSAEKNGKWLMLRDAAARDRARASGLLRITVGGVRALHARVVLSPWN